MASPWVKYDDMNIPYIECGDVQIRLEDEEPSAEIKEKARIELRETPEIVEPALEELRQMVLAETTLHVPAIDEFLILFLRPCKFYPKSAFLRMKKIFKFKIKHAKLYEDLLPKYVRPAFEQGIVRMIPKRDRHGQRVMILEVGKRWKPANCHINDIFRAVQVAIGSATKETKTQICGGIVLFDFDGLSLTHIMQFTPSLAAMILEWVQETLTLRLKAVHVFNNSYLFNMLFAIFKPFIQEKLRKRIHFHGKDTKSLIKMVDPDILPPKYGGTCNCPEVNGTAFADLLQCYTKDFEMVNSFGYNTSS